MYPASGDLLIYIPSKNRDLLYPPRHKCLCVLSTNPPLKFAFSLKKTQIEVVICADVSEIRLPETKNNFSGIDISWATPSVSLSVPLCPPHLLLTDIIVSIIVDAFPLTLSLAVIVNVFTVIANFITYVYSMSLFISLSLALSCLLSLLQPLSHALIVYYIHTNTNNSQR